MNIWVIAIGEPLPLETNKDRLHRCGLVSSELVRRGHNVTWWTSTFNHLTKKHYYDQDTEIILSKNYKIKLLHGCYYGKNISFNRIKNHYEIGKSFKNNIKSRNKPDIIFCAFPSIELSYYATLYALDNKVPIIIDVRDLWPDIFLSVFPKFLGPFIKIVLWKYFKMTELTFTNSTAIIGINMGL